MLLLLSLQSLLLLLIPDTYLQSLVQIMTVKNQILQILLLLLLLLLSQNPTLKACCQAQFQFSANQVELRLAQLSLSVPPTHPLGQVNLSHFQTRKLKFGMEALFNRTRPTSQLASYLLATTSCSQLQLAIANSSISSQMKTG